MSEQRGHVKCTHTYTQREIILSYKKEWNLAICGNIGESGGYYAKWNRSDREKQILYEFNIYGKQNELINKNRNNS